MSSIRIVVLLAALIGACLAANPARAVSGAEALEKQRADTLPPTALYQVPDPLPVGPAGTLIGSEPGDTRYQLPAGVRAVRIVYLSRSASDRAVAASAVVLLPYGQAPSGGWPVIAWAHGTSGVARNCAPSLMKDVYYGWEGLFEYTMLGYAVVAPDYAGLGTPGPHQYMSIAAQAQDVINALPAAHKAVPELGSKWVAVGHSQGGAAVLKLSALEHDLSDSGFLGSVSVAPPTDLYAMWHDFTQGNSEAAGYLDIIALGIKAADASFDPDRMLGPGGLAILPEVANEACVDAASALLADKPSASLLKPHWADDPAVVRFAHTNRPYDAPAKGPILLLQGTADRTIPEVLTHEAANHLCKLGDQVQYQTYAGMDHDPVMYASFRDQIGWIAARFAGQAAPENCH